MKFDATGDGRRPDVALRIENRPGWEGLPVPPSWEPFSPSMTWSQGLKNGHCIWPGFAAATLDEALHHLVNERTMHLSYSVGPARHVAQIEGSVPAELIGGPWQVAPASHLFAYELRWPLLRPGRNLPQRIGRAEDSLLWCDVYCCHSYFVLERDWYGGAIRLGVGGANSYECIAAWLAIGDWIRERLRGLKPGFRVPRKVSLPISRPLRKRAATPEFLSNEVIRAAVRDAHQVEMQAGKYLLRGRGHEPRVCLDRRLAQVLRGQNLPSIGFSGLRADEYPRRIFERAARALADEHGRDILVVVGNQVRLAE